LLLLPLLPLLGQMQQLLLQKQRSQLRVQVLRQVLPA
jgi:hypothetical protein